MELEDQQRREMRERMEEDMIKRTASLSEYTVQELRAMNMRSSPQIFNIGTYTDTSSHFDDAESELEEELKHRELEYIAKQQQAIEESKEVLHDVHNRTRASQLMQESEVKEGEE